jgi:hypothetical protein
LVVVGLNRRSDPFQKFEPGGSASSGWDCKLHLPQTEHRIALIGQQPEAGAAGELDGYRIGVECEQYSAPYGLAPAVAFQDRRIFANESIQPHSAQFEQAPRS